MNEDLFEAGVFPRYLWGWCTECVIMSDVLARVGLWLKCYVPYAHCVSRSLTQCHLNYMCFLLYVSPLESRKHRKMTSQLFMKAFLLARQRAITEWRLTFERHGMVERESNNVCVIFAILIYGLFNMWRSIPCLTPSLNVDAQTFHKWEGWATRKMIEVECSMSCCL